MVGRMEFYRRRNRLRRSLRRYVVFLWGQGLCEIPLLLVMSLIFEAYMCGRWRSNVGTNGGRSSKFGGCGLLDSFD